MSTRVSSPPAPAGYLLADAKASAGPAQPWRSGVQLETPWGALTVRFNKAGRMLLETPDGRRYLVPPDKAGKREAVQAWALNSVAQGALKVHQNPLQVVVAVGTGKADVGKLARQTYNAAVPVANRVAVVAIGRPVVKSVPEPAAPSGKASTPARSRWLQTVGYAGVVHNGNLLQAELGYTSEDGQLGARVPVRGQPGRYRVYMADDLKLYGLQAYSLQAIQTRVRVLLDPQVRGISEPMVQRIVQPVKSRAVSTVATQAPDSSVSSVAVASSGQRWQHTQGYIGVNPKGEQLKFGRTIQGDWAVATAGKRDVADWDTQRRRQVEQDGAGDTGRIYLVPTKVMAQALEAAGYRSGDDPLNPAEGAVLDMRAFHNKVVDPWVRREFAAGRIQGVLIASPQAGPQRDVFQQVLDGGRQQLRDVYNLMQNFSRDAPAAVVATAQNLGEWGNKAWGGQSAQEADARVRQRNAALVQAQVLNQRLNAQALASRTPAEQWGGQTMKFVSETIGTVALALASSRTGGATPKVSPEPLPGAKPVTGKTAGIARSEPVQPKPIHIESVHPARAKLQADLQRRIANAPELNGSAAPDVIQRGALSNFLDAKISRLPEGKVEWLSAQPGLTRMQYIDEVIRTFKAVYTQPQAFQALDPAGRRHFIEQAAAQPPTLPAPQPPPTQLASTGQTQAPPQTPLVPAPGTPSSRTPSTASSTTPSGQANDLAPRTQNGVNTQAEPLKTRHGDASTMVEVQERVPHQPLHLSTPPANTATTNAVQLFADSSRNANSNDLVPEGSVGAMGNPNRQQSLLSNASIPGWEKMTPQERVSTLEGYMQHPLTPEQKYQVLAGRISPDLRRTLDRSGIPVEAFTRHAGKVSLEQQQRIDETRSITQGIKISGIQTSPMGSNDAFIEAMHGLIENHPNATDFAGETIIQLSFPKEQDSTSAYAMSFKSERTQGVHLHVGSPDNKSHRRLYITTGTQPAWVNVGGKGTDFPVALVNGKRIATPQSNTLNVVKINFPPNSKFILNMAGNEIHGFGGEFIATSMHYSDLADALSVNIPKAEVYVSSSGSS